MKIPDSKQQSYSSPKLTIYGAMREMTATSSNKTTTESGSSSGNPDKNRP